MSYVPPHQNQQQKSTLNACIVRHQQQDNGNTVIRPLMETPQSWLGEQVDAKGDWFRPTREFYHVHCTSAHGGGGFCDVVSHERFLTDNNPKTGEFQYGVWNPTNGRVQEQNVTQFQQECAGWKLTDHNHHHQGH